MQDKDFFNEPYTIRNSELISSQTINKLREYLLPKNIISELNNDPSYKQNIFRYSNNILSLPVSASEAIKGLNEINDIKNFGGTLGRLSKDDSLRPEIFDFVKKHPAEINNLGVALGELAKDDSLSSEIFEFIKEHSAEIDNLGAALGELAKDDSLSSEIFEFIKEHSAEIDNLGEALKKFVFYCSSSPSRQDIFDFIKEYPKEINNLGVALGELAKNDSFKGDVFNFIKEHPKEIDNLGVALGELARDDSFKGDVFNFIKEHPAEIDNLGVALGELVQDDSLSSEIFEFIKEHHAEIDNLGVALGELVQDDSFKGDVFKFIENNYQRINNLDKIFVALFLESSTEDKSRIINFLKEHYNVIDIRALFEGNFLYFCDYKEKEDIFSFIQDQDDIDIKDLGSSINKIFEHEQKKDLLNYDICKENKELYKKIEADSFDYMIVDILDFMKKNKIDDIEIKKKIRNFSEIGEIRNKIFDEILLLNLSAKELDSIHEEISSLLNNLNYSELKFLNLVLKKNNFLSKGVLKMFEGNSFCLEVAKDGGRLFLMRDLKKTELITVVNELRTSSFKAWKKLHEQDVPVANIYEHEDIGQDKQGYSMTRVISSYGGQSLREVKEQNIKIPEFVLSKENNLTISMGKFVTCSEYQHYHDGNITVEFIDKEYYQEQLEEGYTVNTIRYDKDKFKYDFEKYVNDEDYECILRFIDFDHFRVRSDA